MAKDKIIIFIDSFQEKNRLQYNLIKDFGYQSVWFQTHPKVKEGIDTVHVLKPGLMARCIQVVSFFFKYKQTIHHIELYPGGRFAFLYLLFAKLFRIQVLCCERGDIYYYIHKKYDRLTRISQYIVYRFADYLWLRELFAADYLKQMKLHRPYFFIHNVVPVPDIEKLPLRSERPIDFLWVNSLKSFRRVEWFGEALDKTEFKDTQNVLLGITEGAVKNEYAQISQKHNLEVHGFVSPKAYYLKAKFFVMPASIVYLNHALLEAMSYGVIPIITEAQGASLIIKQGEDGFITAYEKEAFIVGMKKSRLMDEAMFNQISISARAKIVAEYSETYYAKELKSMYDCISKKSSPQNAHETNL